MNKKNYLMDFSSICVLVFCPIKWLLFFEELEMRFDRVGSFAMPENSLVGAGIFKQEAPKLYVNFIEWNGTSLITHWQFATTLR